MIADHNRARAEIVVDELRGLTEEERQIMIDDMTDYFRERERRLSKKEHKNT